MATSEHPSSRRPHPTADLGFIPDPERRYTATEVRALNAANPRWWPRYECARGRLLVTPAPWDDHQLHAQRLAFALTAYCEAHFLEGLPMLSPSEITWGHRHTYLQPDVYVVPRAMARAARAARTSTEAWRHYRHLYLAAEVLSPSTAAADRGDKRVVYQEEAVPLYWVLDAAEGVAEEWAVDAREARVERERLVWHPDGATVPFDMALAELFRPL